METLFNDSETFQKERPTKATAQQDKDLNYHNKAGGKLFITGSRESTACYYLHEDKDNNGGYVIPYEKVESCCSVI